MKTIKLLSFCLLTVIVSSCSSVRVTSDYDDNADFSGYKTYAFFKEGIDKADISDLDKKRIMRAIDGEFAKKGFTKSEKPDMLVNIFTKSNKVINVDQFYPGFGWGPGWGWGWGPGWGWGWNNTFVSTSTEGTLYIDLIDANKKELVWQGVGTGVLTMDRDAKQQRINEFVARILAQFPPQKK
ncbi:hypothetical protein CHU92_02560 [Flavobacterium cyanobacteriorum]|uniref:DUF4136 domain-containing protein n=1 Tax=Flavobacterium cyanobacteriorum TaxID=2022802 RepID=A0A255ZS74_9FLAO|nr:DUF4136 domain-containing protein [Flavobacterium cyanobacteriorum]OYQ44358.1 hypothetical protein CHU92_02560 [Flavobacterium cyanobacteriorum]